MQRNIRDTALYAEAQAIFAQLRQPGTGQISDAMEIHAAPDGTRVVFTGTQLETLDRTPLTRICQTDLASGASRVLTFGPNTDRLPKFSPDGKTVAFLSDRHGAGDFQLYLLDPSQAVARATPTVGGWVEYLHWSPDGRRILLGVAGHGADRSGGQGAVTSSSVDVHLPSWMPSIATGEETYRWRRAWVYDLATQSVRPVSAEKTNVWEAAWCGNDRLAAVVSPGPGEGLWYSSCLHLIDLRTGDSHEVYVPQDQLGWPAATPSGSHLAIVEAFSSDRGVVAGELRLIESISGKLRRVDTGGVDVSYTEWRSDRMLLLAGHRGFESVVGLYDRVLDAFTEVWASNSVTTAGFHFTVAGLNDNGDCALVGESFTRAPEIGVILQGSYRTGKSFDTSYSACIEVLETVETVSWSAPDGREIQGWLLLPRAGRKPHPLVSVIHGGPVGQSRPRWLGRTGVHILMLLKRGYAVFFPNPRGSSGRGQEFARLVQADMGGAETFDHLSGLDHLVALGLADPARLGVTGISHGGFMTAWLITQDSRFAAAVPVAPVTNFVSQHLISNIPDFVTLFLADTYTNPNGRYFHRSPIMHAQRVTTPTLTICGALDRCTPPEEAQQFHNALLENDVETVLMTYPEEGHGIRNFPAVIDYTARLVGWFERHM